MNKRIQSRRSVLCHPISVHQKAASLLIFALLFSFLYGCATNPVTGKLELTFIPEGSEIAMGSKNYLPTRQSQGGDYLLDPGLSAYVQGVGDRIAKVSDRSNLPYEFVVLNNSVPNAWALPGGKIAINRGLLTELKNEAELAAVLSHEIVHAAARHSAKSMERGLLLQAGLIGIGVAAADNPYADMIAGASGLGLQMISRKYSRSAELEADLYGMKYMSLAGYNPEAAIRLQGVFLKLSKNNRSNWLEGLFASHPPSQERIDTNIRTAATLPPHGFFGEREYRTKMNGLLKTKKAYEAYDEGRKALSNKAVEQALYFADQAIHIEPREALFYGLKGDARVVQKKYRLSLAQYDQAITRNNRFFQFYLQRGLVRENLGDLTAAREDLEQSLTLLPTAHAHNSLGNIGLKMNQREAAINHFRMAADSRTEVGKKAWVSLAKLELPSKPGDYIAFKPAIGKNGTLVIAIQNKSPLRIVNIAVHIALYNLQGQLSGEETVFFRNRLEPGKQSTRTTNLVPLKEMKDLRNVRIEVVHADIIE